MSLVGQTIGNYRVTRQLGEGGMGVVYEAEHPVIGRKVAIKLLHLSLARDPEVVARFFNEARAIHTVGHENIVEIMDFGQTAEGQAYFIMEFLAGEAMNTRIERGAISPVEACEITDQICHALGAAHEKGIVHRDLKPHNVQLLPTPSGRMHVKLLDFGVAKIMNAGDLSQSVKTRAGSLMGTPIYMSPEQCKGAGEIDHRTDIYSLGVMLYEMLAGRPPFIASGVGELFAMHMLHAPPPLTDLSPKTPPLMAAAVMKCLAKDPRERFATMEELRLAFLADGIPMPTYGTSGRTQNYRSRPAPTMTVPTAAHASTTLSASPREVATDASPPKKNSRAGLVLGAVLLVGGAATYFLVAVKGNKGSSAATTDQADTTGVVDQNLPGAPSLPAAAGATAEKPVSKTVTIRFESEPAGAHVARVTDDKDLGAAPFELKLPRAGGKPEYRFHIDGYQDQTLAIDLGSDRTLRATLEKVVAPPPAPPPAPPAPLTGSAAHAETPHRPSSAAAHHGPHPARSAAPSSDDDGLATPKF